jgi:hypothetical protein
MEFIQIHQPNTWAEIEAAITAADDRERKARKSAEGTVREGRPHSRSRASTAIGRGLAAHGWKPRRPGDSDFAKNRVGVEIQLGVRPLDTYDLFARHIARYIGKVIDVGVEILPMKSLQQQMSSGIGYYEGELYNLIREGRGVPAVPLVLIGICPD